MGSAGSGDLVTECWTECGEGLDVAEREVSEVGELADEIPSLDCVIKPLAVQCEALFCAWPWSPRSPHPSRAWPSVPSLPVHAAAPRCFLRLQNHPRTSLAAKKRRARPAAKRSPAQVDGAPSGVSGVRPPTLPGPSADAAELASARAVEAAECAMAVTEAEQFLCATQQATRNAEAVAMAAQEAAAAQQAAASAATEAEESALMALREAEAQLSGALGSMDMRGEGPLAGQEEIGEAKAELANALASMDRPLAGGRRRRPSRRSRAVEPPPPPPPTAAPARRRRRHRRRHRRRTACRAKNAPSTMRSSWTNARAPVLVLRRRGRRPVMPLLLPDTATQAPE